MSLIIPANSAAASGGYVVANSCRFNDGSSDHMLKTASAGNRRTFTFSTWLKLSQLTTARYLFTSWSANNDAGFTYLSLTDGDKIKFAGYGTTYLETTQVLRDPSAWYNLVLAVDTTSGTANNRCRIYLNGSEITSFGTRNNPSQNADLAYNQNSVDLVLGSNNYGGSKGNYFDGYLAETVWIDGTQYAASDFGEFDDSGIWKPIDVSGLTFGTNGFYLDYEASGNLGNDANGGTDLTEANLTAIDQSTDTCTNNFCLINPLDKYIGGTLATYSEGNTRFSSSGNSSSNNGTRCNFAVANGKWYWEVKLIQNAFRFGIQDVDATTQYNSGSNWQIVGTYAVQNNGAKSINNSESASAVTTFSNGDTAMMAMDLENQKLYFGVNGTWSNSGNPESGSSGTGSIGDLVDGTTYIPVFSNGHWSQNTIADFNFGNPAYAISSSNTDGDGYGNFEYAVPSGYYSLNTKNLAEYG